MYRCVLPLYRLCLIIKCRQVHICIHVCVASLQPVFHNLVQAGTHLYVCFASLQPVFHNSVQAGTHLSVCVASLQPVFHNSVHAGKQFVQTVY